jgi:hypothetical protein
MSPPVMAMNSALSNGPMPGRLRMAFAWRCSRSRLSTRASISAISSSSVITSFASLTTVAADSFSPGTAVCWDSAAAIAVAATAAELRTLRFFSQAVRRLVAIRLIPVGVW